MRIIVKVRRSNCRKGYVYNFRYLGSKPSINIYAPFGYGPVFTPTCNLLRKTIERTTPIKPFAIED